MLRISYPVAFEVKAGATIATWSGVLPAASKWSLVNTQFQPDPRARIADLIEVIRNDPRQSSLAYDRQSFMLYLSSLSTYLDPSFDDPEPPAVGWYDDAHIGIYWPIPLTQDARFKIRLVFQPHRLQTSNKEHA